MITLRPWLPNNNLTILHLPWQQVLEAAGQIFQTQSSDQESFELTHYQPARAKQMPAKDQGVFVWVRGCVCVCARYFRLYDIFTNSMPHGQATCQSIEDLELLETRNVHETLYTKQFVELQKTCQGTEKSLSYARKRLPTLTTCSAACREHIRLRTDEIQQLLLSACEVSTRQLAYHPSSFPLHRVTITNLSNACKTLPWAARPTATSHRAKQVLLWSRKVKPLWYPMTRAGQLETMEASQEPLWVVPAVTTMIAEILRTHAAQHYTVNVVLWCDSSDLWRCFAFPTSLGR